MMLPVVTRAQGKGHGVTVNTSSANTTDAIPGQIISGSFLITNTSGASQEFVESLTLPKGWQPVVIPASVVLAPDESIARLTAFQVPSNAPAGRYEVIYSVRSQKDYGIQDYDTITVVVSATNKLVMLIEEKPEVVVAGEAFQLSVRVMNQGNHEIRVHMSATSGASYQLRLVPPDLTLAPSESKVALVQIQSSDKLLKGFSHFTYLRAVTVDDPSGEGSVYMAVPTDIVPTGAKIDMFNRLPSWLQLAASSDGSNAAFQGQFWGGGNLDESGRRKVDFLFRAPDAQNSSFYGLRDEYRAGYFTPNLDMRLGDQTYDLSKLTEYYRYGRGMEVKSRHSGFDVGGFFLDSRWQTPTEQEAGVYLGKRFLDDRAQLRVNFLAKDNVLPSLASADITSIEARFTPVPKNNLRLEFSNCNTDPRPGTDNTAYLGQVDGSYGGLNYTFSKVHAGPSFLGYYNDADYLDGSINVPIVAKLQGYASTHVWKTNLNMDPAQGNAPRNNSIQAGLTYALTPKDSISFDYNGLRHSDFVIVPTSNFTEAALRFGYGRKFAKSSLQLYVAPGWHQDQKTGAQSGANTYSAFYFYGPSDRQYYTIFAQVGDPRPPESILLGGTNTLGISGTWKPTSKLSVSLNYSIQNLNTPSQPVNDQLYFTGVYGTPGLHTWGLQLRRTTPVFTQGATAAYLTYTIPFGIPISQKTRAGIIKGRLFDGDAPGNPGIKRAIIKANGVSTATDSNGEFIFSGLEPGTYLLSVERKSMGLDRVTVKKTPLVLELKADGPTEVQIPTARAAQVSGKVATFAYQTSSSDSAALSSSASVLLEGAQAGVKAAVPGAGPGSAVELGGLGNVLVEISDGAETLRTLTDEKGAFSFEGLRPGDWTVKAYNTNIPALHRLEMAQQSLKLSSGQQSQSLFRVLPVLRPVTVIDQGTISSESAK